LLPIVPRIILVKRMAAPQTENEEATLPPSAAAGAPVVPRFGRPCLPSDTPGVARRHSAASPAAPAGAARFGPFAQNPVRRPFFFNALRARFWAVCPKRRHGLTVCLLLLFSLAALAQSDPSAKKLCAEANDIAKDLTAISGLELRHPVPCDYISKARINEFLQKRVQEAAKPEEIRAEELTLKKFGLVPPEFDLARNTVDLLTEQAAAFYDYDKKKLFITESTPSETQEPVLAHELSHALADQNFNLAKFIRQGRKSDDGASARMAVMEGQATWLMSEYLARKMGQTLKDSPELVAMMSSMSENAGGQYPVFESAPLYERATLIFPYSKGMLFQNAVYQRDGQAAFAEVFRKPPTSTQQILHPDKYFAAVKPADPDLPDARLPHGYKGLVGGSLGELEHGILSSSPRSAPSSWRRTGAAATSSWRRTGRPAAWCCSTPPSGIPKTRPASTSPPTAPCCRRSGRR